ncbi:MAG: hypothetical protein M3Q49_01585 [Actinomycetota bacterium]|nr:hypothetical protein [Actinomycetota bacterium]
MMEERRRGRLAGDLGAPLWGESPKELRLMAREDERRAEEGLVELLEDGELSYKHLAELVPRDLPARLEAEDARTSWLMERAAQRLGSTRNERVPGDRALVGGGPRKEPVREGDGYRCAACGYELFMVNAPLAPDMLPGIDCCGIRMEKVDHGSSMVVRGDGGLERLEYALWRAHERDRSRLARHPEVTRDGAESEMPPARREDGAQ